MVDDVLLMFDADSSYGCYLWAIAAKGIVFCLCDMSQVGSLAPGSVYEKILAKMLLWLTGGHPYKCEASKLVHKLLEHPELQVQCKEQVERMCADKLKEVTCARLREGGDATKEVLVDAITQLSRQ